MLDENAESDDEDDDILGVVNADDLFVEEEEKNVREDSYVACLERLKVYLARRVQSQRQKLR